MSGHPPGIDAPLKEASGPLSFWGPKTLTMHQEQPLMSELALTATVKESLTVETEERRQIQHKTQLYRLKVILAVGYRIKSTRCIQFRQCQTRLQLTLDN